MNPGPNVLVTVMLSETAATPIEGKPVQGPARRLKFLGDPAGSDGAPYGPAGPRVSTIRHGVTPTKGFAWVTSPWVFIPPEDVADAAGTVQLGTVEPIC